MYMRIVRVFVYFSAGQFFGGNLRCFAKIVLKITIDLLGVAISNLAAACTLPAELLPMHWNIPASVSRSPRILKLCLHKQMPMRLLIELTAIKPKIFIE